MLYSKIESKILVNGYLSTVIYILRSVRQGCPVAPLLYILVIETLLIKIKSSPNIQGIKSPTSEEKMLISAFADDTGFFIENVQSAQNILNTFEKFGKASGSRINKDKTEGLWLGRYKNRTEEPLSIKWVKETKSLGMYFGYGDIQRSNWVPCIDTFRRDILKHLHRDTTLIGKTAILNYIGYSKLWFKAMFSSLPENIIYRENGNPLDISKILKELSQGFLWGFCLKENGLEIDMNKPKNPLISRKTLLLSKEKGGTNLIDYNNKMKAFRILLVYKYLKDDSKTWNSILKYWFAVNIYSISNQRWNNCYPHAQEIEHIPPFFKKCLIEFKDYYSKHGTSIHEEVNTKIIYVNLMNEVTHTPAAIIRYPEMGNFLSNLTSYKHLDPYLRYFLFKLYHCKLYFKRYKLNIDDMLNFGQKCILCDNAIDTPTHLFERCDIGEQLRYKRDFILRNFDHGYVNLNENERVFSYFTTLNEINRITHYIITLCNYSIYRIKMKKFYDRNYVVVNNEVNHSFTNRLKLRIICDHRRFSFENFQEIWDPNDSQQLFCYNTSNILSWNLKKKKKKNVIGEEKI